MNKVPISVVIITKNEELNIARCLESVYSWADEIIMVDDQSSDKTVAIAQKYADKIFHRKMDVEGRHRNWSYAQTKNEWVLSLDADETLTEELRDEIQTTLEKPAPELNAYTIPRRNFLGDHWLKFGGHYPSAQLRLFRKQCFRYEEVEVHPRVFVEGGMKHTGHLSKDIIHKSYRDIEHYFAKVNGQTSMEAKKWFQTKRKMSFRRALWRTVDRFFRSFVAKKGYKDGFWGFTSAMFASVYQMLSYAKYWELKRKNGQF